MSVDCLYSPFVACLDRPSLAYLYHLPMVCLSKLSICDLSIHSSTWIIQYILWTLNLIEVEIAKFKGVENNGIYTISIDSLACLHTCTCTCIWAIYYVLLFSICWHCKQMYMCRAPIKPVCTSALIQIAFVQMCTMNCCEVDLIQIKQINSAVRLKWIGCTCTGVAAAFNSINKMLQKFSM